MHGCRNSSDFGYFGRWMWNIFRRVRACRCELQVERASSARVVRPYTALVVGDLSLMTGWRMRWSSLEANSEIPRWTNLRRAKVIKEKFSQAWAVVKCVSHPPIHEKFKAAGSGMNAKFICCSNLAQRLRLEHFSPREKSKTKSKALFPTSAKLFKDQGSISMNV